MMLSSSIATNAAVVEMNDMDNNVGINSEKRSRYIDFQDLASLGVLTIIISLSLSYYIIYALLSYFTPLLLE